MEKTNTFLNIFVERMFNVEVDNVEIDIINISDVVGNYYVVVYNYTTHSYGLVVLDTKGLVSSTEKNHINNFIIDVVNVLYDTNIQHVKDTKKVIR